MRALFAFALGACLTLPGCGMFGSSSALTLTQQQQLALNGASSALAAGDGIALQCLADAIPLCVQNKAEIKKQSAKLTADIQTAQAVITAGGNAGSTMTIITAELVAFALLYTQPKA